MFRITSKVKIAAGIAAGALTLGAAGAYAANANNTIPTYTLTSPPLSHGGQTLKLVSLNQNATLTLPSTPFKNQGQCVSWFAQNRTLALAPAAGTTTVRKNYHGKLMGGVQKFCATYEPAKGASDTAENDAPDATQSTGSETEASDATDLQSGSSHGHGHGHGHGAD